MKHTLRLIIAPLLSLALLMLSNGFFLTFISAKLYADHYSPMSIGIIQGSYYGGFLIAALKSEGLIQRIKHIRAFSFFAAIGTACTLMTVFADHIAVWIFFRFVVGMCIAALYVVIESWLLMVTHVKNRGVVLALYMFALYSSQSLSQYIINFIDINSMIAFIIAGFLSVLSVLPVTFTHTRIPEMDSTPARAILKYLVVAPLGTIGAVLAGIILGSFYTFAPTYAQFYKISIANLMSFTIAGGFLLQYPIGHLSDIFDRRAIVVLVGIASLFSAVAIILCTGHPFWIYLFSFLLGGFTFTIYPLSVTQVVDRSPSDALTTVAGIVLFAYSIGAVIGPLVTPLFVTIFGSEIGLYYFIALTSLLLGVIGILIIFLKRSLPAREQEAFIPLPPQTPVGYDLDPRSEDPKNLE